MKRKREKSYSTGEFAKYFGIPKDTLLYYDRIGLFSPEQVAPNGYRRYTASQLGTFGTLLSLREMNVSIQEIRQYLGEKTPEHFSAMAEHHLQKLEEEIQKLEEIRRGFRRTIRIIGETREAPLEQVLFRDMPEMPLIFYEDVSAMKDLEENPHSWWDACNNFILEVGIFGIPYVGSYIGREHLEKKQYTQVDRLFMWSDSPGGIARPAGTYALLYHKGPYETLQEAYVKFFEELGQRRCRLAGGAYEEYLLDELEASRPEDYITKISVRVIM